MKVKKEAIEQLKSYLKHDTTLSNLENLCAYVIVFVGNEGKCFAVDG